MSVKQLIEYLLEFLSFNGGCTGSSESRLVKTLHCWKSHVAAHMFLLKGVGVIHSSNDHTIVSSLIYRHYGTPEPLS